MRSLPNKTSVMHGPDHWTEYKISELLCSKALLKLCSTSAHIIHFHHKMVDDKLDQASAIGHATCPRIVSQTTSQLFPPSRTTTSPLSPPSSTSKENATSAVSSILDEVKHRVQGKTLLDSNSALHKFHLCENEYITLLSEVENQSLDFRGYWEGKLRYVLRIHNNCILSHF